ncbi:hypothetical protein D7Y21_09285 [Corallococcus sp. AB045]|uniref:hypothetical protein n=1 Tax=Corallococcus sp. AB045 TaxID=2316719 RepID=UPI000EC2A5FE|nr:hypothetical protein [Corallococcus sp. AB045]RKH89779.1 hypothetical protein D7Y21_09285 [Corallococcus sp. AB045]
MGMYGEVLGIGPFHRELVPFLQQPEAWHWDTREGAIIVVPVFSAPEGSSRSRALAECLGADPWDFNTHALDPWRADVDALKQFEQPGEAHRLECFLRLRDAGFSFYFQPNG